MTEFVPVSGLDAHPHARALFDAWAGVFAACAEQVLRGDADERTADELRELEREESKERLGFAVVDDDRVIGSLGLIFPLRDNLTHSFLRVAVLPASRGRGIGSALLARGEELAQARGRRTVQAHSVAAPDRPDPDAAFLQRRGYVAAQRLLRSDLAVGEPTPRAPLAPGYDLQTRVGRIPPGWRTAYAGFQRAMSTDAPLGELALDEEDWDEQRVAALDARDASMGRENVLVVARLVGDQSTRGFAGLTQVQWAPQLGHRAYQHDTLVLRGHRGHGLGLALKAAALTAVRESWPQVSSIRTWNADDNTHMLAVNRALGYVPNGVMTEWQKRLPE